MGILTEKPRWCKVTDEFGLTVTRCNVDDDPLFLTSSDILEDGSEFAVMWANFIPRIDVQDEV